MAGRNNRHSPNKAVADFAAVGRGRACPICGSPARTDYRPFCSKRCADIDLGRWLKGVYAVPAVKPPDGDSPDQAEES